MKNLAAIDLGTNTFHIIIVSYYGGGGFDVIYRQREFVKLAEDGFDKISERLMEHSIDVLKGFAGKLSEYNVYKYKAYATSIFREAENGHEFVLEIKKNTGLDVTIIDGDKEASLIYEGAKLSGALSGSCNMLMDIGGGSVEFIIADEKEIYFKKSLPLGIMLLYHMFKHAEPFDENTIGVIFDFLDNNTAELKEAVRKYDIDTVIGTAGSFEVLSHYQKKMINPALFELSAAGFYEIYDLIAYTTYEERLKIEAIPPERKRLIVYAFVLIKFALQLTGATKLRVTSYSMKEGMIAELIRELG